MSSSGPPRSRAPARAGRRLTGVPASGRACLTGRVYAAHGSMDGWPIFPTHDHGERVLAEVHARAHATGRPHLHARLTTIPTAPAAPRHHRRRPRRRWSLGGAFAAAGWPVVAVASRDAGRRDRFRRAVPGARAYPEAAPVLDDVDIAFLTVPDDALATVAAGLRLYAGQGLVHTSGLVPAAVLAPALAAGTLAASFHPLVAFAGRRGAWPRCPAPPSRSRATSRWSPCWPSWPRRWAPSRCGCRRAARRPTTRPRCWPRGGVVLLDAIVEARPRGRPRRGGVARRLPAPRPAGAGECPDAGRRGGAHRAHRAWRRGHRARPPGGPGPARPGHAGPLPSRRPSGSWPWPSREGRLTAEQAATLRAVLAAGG